MPSADSANRPNGEEFHGATTNQAHHTAMNGQQNPSAPIFVVGFQRSGTTLLQALLGAHPRIASPPETYFITRIYHLRDYWGDLRDAARLRRVVEETVHPPIPLLAD